MKSIIITIGILLILCASICLQAEAHKFYASFVTINYNEQEKNVEITFRAFPDDLEAALSKLHNKSVKLDDSKETTTMVMAYLKKTFEIKKNNRPQQLQWVGMEVKVDSAWIYVEAKMPGGLSGAQLRDQFLFDMFNDQTNVVSLKYNGKQVDHVFRGNDGFKPLP
jgi:hypothetical protein